MLLDVCQRHGWDRAATFTTELAPNHFEFLRRRNFMPLVRPSRSSQTWDAAVALPIMMGDTVQVVALSASAIRATTSIRSKWNSWRDSRKALPSAAKRRGSRLCCANRTRSVGSSQANRIRSRRTAGVAMRSGAGSSPDFQRNRSPRYTLPPSARGAIGGLAVG